MVKTFTGRKRIRKSFGRIPSVTKMPDLIGIQKNSYARFLGSPDGKDKESGLHEVLSSIFPIKDFSGRGELEYVKYELDEPKYDVAECIQRGMTYAAPLHVTLRLVVWDIDEETGARSIRDIKEQDVYMGDMPLMTETGTFVVNGTERVIVSQMHRSPGVFFDHDKGKTQTSGKFLFAARVIPYRGSWLDFEFDAKDLINVRIDRRRKLPVTTLLYALESRETEALRKEREAEGRTVGLLEISGMGQEEILDAFYDKIVYTASKKGFRTPFVAKNYKGAKLRFDLVNAETGEVLIEAGEKANMAKLKKFEKDGVSEILVSNEEIVGRFMAQDIINEKTGEILCEAGDEITEDMLSLLTKNKVKGFAVLNIDNVNVGAYIRNTMAADKNRTREEALVDIYKVMRPGEPPTIEAADKVFRELFFDKDFYDLSDVGRVKMNARLKFSNEDVPDTVRVLRKEDIIEIVRVLHELKDGRGEIDDIDNLGNRRVRSVGELMENQYRIGLLRMERAIRELMSSVDIDTVMPHDLINAKPAAVAVREFFASSQLSQFMDQNNPLAEITHKRRLSALGPGGLTRDRAGFEVRDVHPTHYGRICPIETPEGPNIGLINSLATYARINKYGFIETPYRKVENGKVTKDVVYLTAMEEDNEVIAEANAELDSKNCFVKDKLVSCRKKGEFVLCAPSEITLIDVAPQQLVSVAAALIPFLENDDANRALMGANMQRQAVPLLRSEAPLVGTGMEAQVARDSGATILAKRDGVVQSVDAMRIVVRATGKIKADETGVDIYRLHKFQRSNQSTCITQQPLVKVGDIVAKGDIIADGASTQLGELALGRNVLVAYMPWNGYNYEDAVLISERIARDDIYTSIHIDEFEVMARDTKLGQEEITRDIPNVNEESLKQLDEAGVVYIGAEVKAGDILVGKVTPKGESPMTPEEKLLRAIFGEKAADVRDSSLRVPPGIYGTVVEVRVFSRRGVEKDQRAMAIEQSEIEALAKDRDAEKSILEGSFYDRLKEKLVGQVLVSGFKNNEAGATITEEMLNGLPKSQWRKVAVESDETMAEIEKMGKVFDADIEKLQERFEDKVEKLQRGDELPPGVLKMVKVFIAVKRKLQPGDKMAGRHGNKGVVSRVLPIEDMPYIADGTPVDIVLNPLGVPSRMNVGQILECHLGWACRELGKQVYAMAELVKQDKASIDDLRAKLKDVYGKKYDDNIDKLADDEVMELAENLKGGLTIATPVFDGAHEADINAMLEKAGLPTSGQVTVYDGRTGEPFERPITVGVTYFLKLHHLVDEKIHARSTGPYSLVTQQPLGGKAQFGGQRFGEMEVWALESYGAAYTLQEILTVKSDDVAGRTKAYESISKGIDKFEAGVPESFNVLVKEMQSLCLDVELKQNQF